MRLEFVSKTFLHPAFFENYYLDFQALNDLVFVPIESFYKIKYKTILEIEIILGGSNNPSTLDFNFLKVKNNEIKGFSDYYYEFVNWSDNEYGHKIYIFRLNLFYTFMSPFFNPVNNTNTTPIFFKQKHVNRFLTATAKGALYLDFQKQYYLNNIHPALANFNESNQIVSVINPIFSPKADDTNFALYLNPQLPNQASYLYLVVSKSPQSTALGAVNINQTALYAVAVNEIQYLNILSSADILDVILLPIPPSQFASQVIFQSETNLISLANFTNVQTYSVFTQSLFSFQALNFYSLDMLNLMNEYSFNVLYLNQNTNPADNFIEPLLFNKQFYQLSIGHSFKTIDLNLNDLNLFVVQQSSFFESLNQTILQNINNFLKTLSVSFNYPEITLYFNNQQFKDYANNDYSIMWSNLNTHHPFLNLELSQKLISISNNWTTFLAQNKNAYNISKTQAEINLAQTTANIVFDTAAGTAEYATAADPFTTSEGIAAGSNMISKAMNAGFDLAKQSVDFNYNFGGGKKDDMSRIANISAGVNLPVWNAGYNLFWCEKFLPLYLQKIIWNYVYEKGYIVNRICPFNFWYNRKFFNYIEILNFCQIYTNQNLSSALKKAINAIAENGFTVISLAGFIQMKNTFNFNIFKYDLALNFNMEINLANNQDVKFWDGEYGS